MVTSVSEQIIIIVIITIIITIIIVTGVPRSHVRYGERAVVA